MTGKPETKLTLGPLLFNWPAEMRRDFYFRIADEAPVDSVCIGEVVCSKRAPLYDADLPAIVERLQAGGKEVVQSTLALIMQPREMREVAETADGSDLLVEANDIGAVSALHGKRHAIGPFVNIYNEGTVAFLAGRGAARICLPAELAGESVIRMAAGAGDVELEVQAFGRLPLALSARCYHARAHGLQKDSCQYVCDRDVDGMPLDTMDGAPFLAVNGTQTMSHHVLALMEELPDLVAAGIHRFRLWPQATDMVAVATVYREVLDGRLSGQDGLDRLEEQVDFAPFANGFYHGATGAEWIA